MELDQLQIQIQTEYQSKNWISGGIIMEDYKEQYVYSPLLTVTLPLT